MILFSNFLLSLLSNFCGSDTLQKKGEAVHIKAVLCTSEDSTDVSVK